MAHEYSCAAHCRFAWSTSIVKVLALFALQCKGLFLGLYIDAFQSTALSKVVKPLKSHFAQAHCLQA